VRSPVFQELVGRRRAQRIAGEIAAVHGDATAEEVGFKATTQFVGPIVTPLISVVGAIFGLKAGSLFERMADLASTSVRGVDANWKHTGLSSGVLSLGYPPPIDRRCIEPNWRGAVRYIFHTVKVDGQITEAKVEGSTLSLFCTWRQKS
jgi:hypothetical protein